MKVCNFYVQRCFLLLLFFLTFSLYGDTIVLKNGKVIHGKIIAQSRTQIQIRTENGQKMILKKREIQRIRYGLTPKEIAEKKRKEELRRKQEERRRREERRRQEELRRKQLERQKQEELKRKQKEELKRKTYTQKRIFRKRNLLSLGWGLGLGSVTTPLSKIFDLYYKTRLNSIILNLVGNNIPGTFRYVNFNFPDRTITSNQLLVQYQKDDVEWGIRIFSFDLEKILKNIQRTDFGVDSVRGSLTNYISVPFAPSFKEQNYSTGSLWFRYDWYRFSFPVIMGVHVGIDVSDISGIFTSSIWNSVYVQNDQYQITTDENGGITIGPVFTYLYDIQNQIIAQLLYSEGTFQFQMKHDSTRNYQDSNNPDWEQITTTLKGKSRSLIFSLQWQKKINPDINLFVQYLNKESRYAIVTMTGEIITSSMLAGTSNIPPFIGDVIFEFTTMGEEQRIIEKNQTIQGGILYKIQL